MSDDNNRQYETFYGIYMDDWSITHGPISTQHILIKEYLSDGCSTTSNTVWYNDFATSTTTIFIYPHNIKKKYFIEGVIQGQICFTSVSGATSFVSDYQVSVVKINNVDNSEETLASTGIISVNDKLVYDSTWHTGSDIVFPFWIDVFSSAKAVGENDRLGVRVNWDINNSSTVTASLMHDNDSQFEDLKITIPFMLG